MPSHDPNKPTLTARTHTSTEKKTKKNAKNINAASKLNTLFRSFFYFYPGQWRKQCSRNYTGANCRLHISAEIYKMNDLQNCAEWTATNGDLVPLITSPKMISFFVLTGSRCAHSRNNSTDLLATSHAFGLLQLSIVNRSWNFKCAFEDQTDVEWDRRQNYVIIAQWIEFYLHSSESMAAHSVFSQLSVAVAATVVVTEPISQKPQLKPHYVRCSAPLPVWFATSYINKSHENFCSAIYF